MTRFARAQGSKSSNVRTPEDSTPWEVMQEQILKTKRENEESKKREEAEKQRIENYNKFLKDRKTEKRKAAWCEFPETSVVKKPKDTSLQLEVQLKKKNKKNKTQIDSDNEINTENSNNTSETDCVSKKKQKKNKTKLAASSELINSSDIIESSATEISTLVSVSKKKQNKNTAFTAETQQDDSKVLPEKSMKKKKNKKCHDKTEVNEAVAINNTKNDNKHLNEAFNNKSKKLKNQNSIPTRRKAVNDNSFELIINGKNIELVRYDGFPIMKKDAEKLEELKQNMIKKGIPKSEVQRTMKLERRRAEKALARVKREVCYNCRKGGHNLSDCPDLKSRLPGKDVAEGICFKCGSTEHRQFECKVQRDKEFRFATCFVCKESGHIARQCPDNPKGLYPNGGCCKLCGDVTHLRKDCPTVNDKKEETSIKLQTLSSNDIEDIGQSVKKTEETQKKPKKIKF